MLLGVDRLGPLFASSGDDPEQGLPAGAQGCVQDVQQGPGPVPVKLVEVDGDYLAPSGPMMESSGTKKGWMLKGAIVEGPNGNVFFKFTGPKKVLEAEAKKFDGMLESLRKG